MLQGTIPPDGLPLPDSLQELYLFNSRITGSLPEQWALPPELLYLTFADNNLNGTLPALALPPTMQKLYLSGNELSGSLPPQWELPEGLLELDLAVNNLSGKFLGCWSNRSLAKCIHLQMAGMPAAVAACWVVLAACRPAAMSCMRRDNASGYPQLLSA